MIAMGLSHKEDRCCETANRFGIITAINRHVYSHQIASDQRDAERSVGKSTFLCWFMNNHYAWYWLWKHLPRFTIRCCCGDVVQREIKKIQTREKKDNTFNQMTTQHMNQSDRRRKKHKIGSLAIEFWVWQFSCWFGTFQVGLNFVVCDRLVSFLF